MFATVSDWSVGSLGIHPGRHCQVFIYLGRAFSFGYKGCCQALSSFLDSITIEMSIVSRRKGKHRQGKLFLYIYIIYLLICVCISILAVLGLRCCMQAFSSCNKWGLLSGCGAQASYCSGLSCCRAQALGCGCFSSCGSPA